MFNKFTNIEKRYVLEMINSIAQVDGTFTDEEGCILAAIAYLMEIDLDIWRPNLVDVSLSYSRVGEMSKNKIEETLILLLQVSIFDGLVKYEELSTILPLAYEANITDEEMLGYGRRAFSGEKFTTFDKLLVYALCVKMMEVDSEVSKSEKKTLSKIQLKFDLPANFIDRQLVNNIDWALNIMSAYSIKKRYRIIEYLIKVRDSDGKINEHEANLLIKVLGRLGLKEYEFNESKIIQCDIKIYIEKFAELSSGNTTSWEKWLDFVKEIFYEEHNHSLYEKLEYALKKSFELGLVFDEDKYDYLEAKRILATIYFEKHNYKELNLILKEVQKLNVIPKWYWSMLSRMDFDQLEHGIKIKNERLLDLSREYRKYGEKKKTDLLAYYRGFVKKYKNFSISVNEQKLHMEKITKITGLKRPEKNIERAIKTDNKVKYYGRILVLGASKGKKKEQLLAIAKEYKVYADFEFGPDYDELSTIGIEKYKGLNKYNCIFVAQSPHSAKGIKGASSVVRRLRCTDFAPSIELRTKANKLYLTDTSFRSALKQSLQYLRSNE